MNQQKRSLAHVVAKKHVAPDGEVGLGQTRRVDFWHPFRKGQAMIGVNGHVFRVPAPMGQGAYPVADAPTGCFFPDCGYGPRNLKAKKLRSAFGRGIVSLPLQEVGSVHSGRSHLCQDLVRGRSRQRAFRDFEYIRPAGFANRYGAHGRWHWVCHRRSPGNCDLHFPNISHGRRNRAAAPGCPVLRHVSIASPANLMAWTGSALGREPDSRARDEIVFDGPLPVTRPAKGCAETDAGLS